MEHDNEQEVKAPSFWAAEVSREAGMTLIEIIIVVALLGTLMTYLVSQLTSTADSAKEDQAKLAMASIGQALQMYRVHNNRYPKELDELIRNTGDNKRWRGPYIEENKMVDPFGQKFTYESDGRKYKITSGGIDEQVGTGDDLTYPEGSAGGGAAPEGG